MDTHEKPTSDSPDEASVSSHRSEKKVDKKKSYRVIIVSAIVIVGLAIGTLGTMYSLKQSDDKKVADKALADKKAVDDAATAKKNALVNMTPEERMTATLNDGVKQQLAALRNGDDKKAIYKSVAAANAVGDSVHAEDYQQ